MSTAADFKKVVWLLKNGEKPADYKEPSNETKLAYYGLFKQATIGDVTGSQPWAVQVESRAKWDAWNSHKGLSADDAMKAYVAEIEKTDPVWRDNAALANYTNVDLNPSFTADKNNGATEDDEDEAEATFEDDNMDKDKNIGEEEKVGEESDEDMENDELELVAKESDKNEVETESQENEKNAVESENQEDTLEVVEEENNNDAEEANTQETLTLKESEIIKTQESLTLMASQFDDDDMEFTQDDRFSQVSVMGGVTTETEKPAQPKQAEFEEEPQDDFSQTERFSQFTQTQTTGPVFEMDDNAEDEAGEEEDADQLGQTMGDAALSMEY